jgi:hypothetical protein
MSRTTTALKQALNRWQRDLRRQGPATPIEGRGRTDGGRGADAEHSDARRFEEPVAAYAD